MLRAGPPVTLWHGSMVTHPVIVGMLGPGWRVGEEAAWLALDIPILGRRGHRNCFIVVCFQRKVFEVPLGQQLPREEDVANLQVAHSFSVALLLGDVRTTSRSCRFLHGWLEDRD